MDGSPVAPAMHALNRVRAAIQHLGKQGGHKNEKLQAWLSVIEATLIQIEPLGTMVKTVNQQSEIVVKIMRDLSRIALPPGNGHECGDDGSSETKGA